MKLSVGDRVTIMGKLFPENNDFVGIRAVKSIRKKIDLSTKEIADIEFTSTPDPLVRNKVYMDWKKDKEKPLNVTFDSTETKFLKENVKRLDAAKQIAELEYSLFESINALPD
jgi:hypothetical protein